MSAEPIFERYSECYDLLYRDKDYAGEAAYVAQALRAVAPSASRLLEFGSGTGRHGRLLAGHGFDVVGIERSAGMAAAAEHGQATSAPHRFSCVVNDIRDVRLPQTFDAVVSLFHVVSYQVTNDDLMRAFASARAHLREGGLFLFDVWHGPAVLADRPAVRVKRVEDDRFQLSRIAEPEIDTQEGTVTVRYTVLGVDKRTGHMVDFVETHRVRYLFPTEIALLATAAGFEIVRTEEFLTGAPASDRTWGVSYLLRYR